MPPKLRNSEVDVGEIEQLRALVAELKEELSNRNENGHANHVEELRAELAELRTQMMARPPQGGDAFRLPDPFKYLSEFSGNKKELSAWIEEVSELYDDFKVRNANGGYSLDSLYVRAIKNKVKGEARTILCANGNPNTIDGIKKILVEHYGDEKDFTTNLSTLFRTRKGDKGHLRFYNEIKETNTRLKANLQSNPLTAHEIIEIITVAKYLDNIQEPLGSIIRNSKPKNLEEAHQAVLLNINAESRTANSKTQGPSIQKQSSKYPNKYNNNNNNNSYDHDRSSSDGNYKSRPGTQPNTSHKNAPTGNPSRKQQYQQRTRAEAHNNETEEVDKEPEAEDLDDNDDLTYSDSEELNFQQAGRTRQIT